MSNPNGPPDDAFASIAQQFVQFLATRGQQAAAIATPPAAPGTAIQPILPLQPLPLQLPTQPPPVQPPFPHPTSSPAIPLGHIINAIPSTTTHPDILNSAAVMRLPGNQFTHHNPIPPNNLNVNQARVAHYTQDASGSNKKRKKPRANTQQTQRARGPAYPLPTLADRPATAPQPRVIQVRFLLHTLVSSPAANCLPSFTYV